MSNPRDLSTRLQAFGLFSCISDEARRQLASETRTMRLGKQQVLFHQGDLARGFFGVAEGTMELSVANADGSRKVVEVISQDQTFGEAIVFSKRPYPVTATALAKTTVYFFPSEAIERHLLADPSSVGSLLAGLSARLHGLVQDVEMYALDSAVERVIGYLLRAVGTNPQQAPCMIELDVSKHVIASRLNLTPETFSRALRRLTDQEAISVHGKLIRILPRFWESAGTTRV